MTIKCKACGCSQGTPQLTSSLVPMISAAILTFFIWRFLALYDAALALMAALPVWVSLFWVVWEIPRWATLLRYGLRRCRRCGAHSWSKPRYSGFGV